jgi:hypothetical protein
MTRARYLTVARGQTDRSQRPLSPGLILRVEVRAGRAPVTYMQLAVRRSAPGAMRRFEGYTRLSRQHLPDWVRVQDQTGHVSRWRAIRRG